MLACVSFIHPRTANRRGAISITGHKSKDLFHFRLISDFLLKDPLNLPEALPHASLITCVAASDPQKIVLFDQTSDIPVCDNRSERHILEIKAVNKVNTRAC